MSFMFNPFPYEDETAINRISADGIDLSEAYSGNDAVAEKLNEVLRSKGAGCVIGIDGYTTAPFDAITGLITERCLLISTSDLFRPAAELRELLHDNLPEDRVKDPVLLYGKLFTEGFTGLFDPARVEAAIEKIKSAPCPVVLCGYGALSDCFAGIVNVKIWADITPKRAVLNVKAGGYRNYGNDCDLPYKVTMRRCYYVDFEVSFSLRCRLLAAHALDYYICADRPGELQLLGGRLLDGLLCHVLDYPFRQKPVYLEGVWGGYYIMKYRNLPDTMKNCAWVFDMIPMEVSTVIECSGQKFEFPFYAVVAAYGEKLMGIRCMQEFHGFFPIRFNYDDTFHASGNMSIQLHPGADWVVNNHNELGRQDESYYIVVTGQGAITYLGFNSGVDVDEFVEKVKQSEREHCPVDYKKYIHAEDSYPGMQVMIPAGTIHASGQNQVILEIGSLTVGSYTYKMYDYLRRDLDGNPRPIHSYYGEINLNRNMTEQYVRANLVNGRKRIVREGGEGDQWWQEMVVGECDQLYIWLKNLLFGDCMEDDTKGDFCVLTLVDGERVTVRSKAHPERKYDMNYLDIVVVPADMGEFELINGKPGTRIVMHKTMLKRV